MTDLLPCPFCGGEAKLYSIGTGSPHYGHYYQVVCQGCLTSSGAYWSGEQSAVQAWNTRTELTCKCVYRDCGDGFGGYYCTVCGEYMDKSDRYCPNCGLKVVE